MDFICTLVTKSVEVNHLYPQPDLLWYHKEIFTVVA